MKLLAQITKQVSVAVRILQRNRDESARASHLVVKKGSLMTYERAVFGQAEREKFSFSTFLERKTMSTKTTIKRIALVAAVAAAFGGLSTVAANATGTYTTTASASNPTTASVGTPVTVSFTDTSTATGVLVADAVNMTPTLSTKPTNSGLGNGSISVVAGALSNATQVITASTGVSVSPVVTDTIATAATAVSITNNYTFTPDVPGTYVVTVNTTNSANIVVTYTAPLFLNHASDSSVIGVSSSTGNALTAVTGGFATAAIEANTASAPQYIVVTGGTVVGATATAGGTLTNAATGLATTSGLSNSLVWTPAATTGTLAIQVYSATAGVATITDTPVTAATGVPGTPVVGTITFGAAPTVSAQYSTAYIGTGTTAVSSDATTLNFADTPSTTTPVANVAVQLNSAASTVITGQALTVTVAGPGLVAVGNNANPSAASGKSVVTTATSDSTGTFVVYVYADGTSGTSTITIADGTTTIATKTVTFTGAAAKAKATQGLYVAKAGAALGANPSHYLLEGAVVGNGAADPAADSAKSGTAAIVGTVTDANGNAVAGATVQLVSSNTAVITTGACDEVTLGTYAAAGTWQCQVSGASGALSGQSAKVTFEVYDATTAAYDITAAPLTFTIGGAITKETLATDAASYASLAPVVLTVNATDASGNPAYDQDGTLVASLVSSTQLGGTLASPVELVEGVGTEKGLYAPAVAGSFTISGLDNVSVAGEAVSVTADSTGGSADTQAAAATDAASEATDAANAATDAANAAADSADQATAAAEDAGSKADAALAAVTALSQQVTTLLSKIAALTAAVAKIAKKVKA